MTAADIELSVLEEVIALEDSFHSATESYADDMVGNYISALPCGANRATHVADCEMRGGDIV